VVPSVGRDECLPGCEASVRGDGVVAGRQQSKVVPDRVLVVAVTFAWKKLSAVYTRVFRSRAMRENIGDSDRSCRLPWPLGVGDKNGISTEGAKTRTATVR
jgi:hypothetical protein